MARLIILGFALTLLSACGGGGGSSGKKSDARQAPTGDSASPTQPSPSDTPDDNATPPAPTGAPDRGAETGVSGVSVPVIVGIATDQGLIGPGRIIDSTIAFMGTGPRGNVVEIYLNGQLAGSSVARDDGSWMLDYSVIALVPGIYSCTLISVSPAGVEIPSAAPFIFQYDPTAPLAPIISGITNDSANILDGITNDNTLVISGTAEADSVLELFLNNVLIGTTQVDGNGNWLIDYSAVTLADGNYALSAESIYLTLRSATSALFPVVVDTLVPAAPVIGGISPDTGISSVDGITNNQRLMISGMAEPDATVRVQLDGITVGSVRSALDGSWVLNYSVVALAEGNYLLRALQVDNAGNTSVLAAPFPVTIDVTPPANVSGFSFSPDTGVLGDNITNSGGLLLSGNAPANEWVTVLINGVAIGTVQANALGAWQLDHSATILPDATYLIATQVSDAAGNQSPVSTGVSVIIDSILPAAPVISGFSVDTGTLGDFLTADSTLVLNGTADPGGTLELFVNGVSAGTTAVDNAGNWQFDYSSVVLGVGVYIFTTTVTDLSGNLSLLSSNFLITVDNIAPAMPVITSISTDTGIPGDGITSDNTLIISGVAEAGAQVTVFVDGVAAGTVTASGLGLWNLDHSASPLADGIHALRAQATDAAGNVSLLSLPFTVFVDSGNPAAPVVQTITTDTATAGDGITSDNTLVFAGIAEADSTVQVLINGSVAGSVSTNGAGVWSFDYTGTVIADGAYSVTAIATDASGNTSVVSAVFSLVIDTAAPLPPGALAINVDTGTVGDGITSDNTLVLSGTTEANASINVSQDGAPIGAVASDGAGNWVLDYSAVALAEGSYTFTATATDAAGNVSSASTLVITIDFTVPVVGAITNISTDSGIIGDGITNDATLVFSGTSEAAASVTLVVDGVAVGNVLADGSGNWSVDYSGTTLPDGAHTVWIVVTDAAGNSSAASPTLNIVIDTGVPSTPTITGVSDDTGVLGDGVTSDNTLSIAGTADIGIDVTVLINAVTVGTVIADGSGNWVFDYTATALSDGSYTLTAVATDVAGNVSAVSSAFIVTIDTGVPAAPVISGITTDTGTAGDGITSDTTLLVAGTAEAGAGIRLALDAVEIATTTADGSGNWSVDYSGTALADGTYSFTAIATDGALNTSGVSAAFTVVIDTAAPAVPVIATISDDTGTPGDGITSDASLIITGTADAGSNVSILIDAVAQGIAVADGSGNWSFDYTGTTLAAGSYVITATASDTAGNVSAASAALNITIDTSAPAAPVITGITTDTGAADGITSDTTLLVSGTAEAGATVIVLVGGVSVGNVVAVGGVWTFDYTGTILAPGNYAFNATATDVAGNISSASSTFNVTVDTSAPNVPVIVSITTDTGAADGVTSDTTLFISGTSDASAIVQVYLDGGSLGTTTADGSGNWVFDYSGTVLAQGTYALTAVASDIAANTSAASGAFNITIDTAAPAAPAVTAITTDTGTPGDGITSDNQLIISGTAEANSVVTVRRDGVALGTTTADGSGVWSYDDTATTLSDGSYTLTALATDLAGNVSSVSANFVITIDVSTPAAPAVTAITTDSASADGITNDNTLVISGTGDTGLTVTVMLDGSSIGNATVDGSGNWTFSYIGTTLADGSYIFTATQQNGAGSVSVVSGDFAVTIDTANPVVATLTPVDGAANVGFTNNLVIVFDGVVTAQSGNIVIRNASDNSVFESIPVGGARVTGSGTNTITIDPAGTFVGGSDYYVQIDATAFDDVAGNSYAGIANTTSWNFTTAPTAIISSTPADDATGVLLNASIILNFNESVTVNTGNIVIRKMSDNSAWDTISVGSGQVSGSGTSTITITQADVLEPNTAYYVEIAAGAFRNARSVNFSGVAGNSALNFTSANVPIPTVVNVTSSTANGTYGVGAIINVAVVFSEIVNVTLASPNITLDMVGVDRTVTYASGTGTTTLNFNYTVVLGDSSADLDYLGTSALVRNGARIRSVNFANANLALFTPGAAGSLGSNKNIVIDASSLDLSAMTAADGFQVQGSTAGEHLGWAVTALGDVNGDGYEDFVTGAPDNNGSAGVAYVVYGQPGATRSNFNTSAITNGTNGFKIVGQSAVDKLGGSVGGAGDINDDGYADIFVVAPLDDDYGSDAGIVYVIYGKASNTDINISSFGSSNGFRITTSEASARIADSFTGFNGNGQGIDAGGDFNGDGVDDLIIGLRYADKSAADSGKAYVIFGKKAATRSDVNLDLISDTGPDGMLIHGASAGWQLGQSVRFVGDYDADGYDDVLVGAIFSNAVASNAGQAYLIFGAPGPVFFPINVSTLSGGSGFKIYAGDVSGIIGHAGGGGDFNGDGISDVVVSSNGKSINGKSGNGAAFVIYGNDSGSYSNIDVDTMLSSTGYAIYGETAADNMGHSLESAGDFNGDGVDDLLLGTYLNSEGGSYAGAAWMVMGQDGNTRNNVDLENITNLDGVKIIGDAADDRLAQSTGHGDINGDGYNDLILGAPLGDNASADGGETLVIWGREFSQRITVGLVGDSNANNIVGTSGNDIIISGGGADAISAGAGNDTIQLSDTGFYNIEGGLGTDTLQFVTTLNTLNLSTLGPEVINGIEIIDLGSSNSLQVSKEGVQALSRESRILYVKGDNSDVVTSTTGDAWCYTGTKIVGGITYNVYLDNGAVLYIQNSIDSSGVTNFNSTQTYTFNTTFVGANVSSSVTNFPVLIRISNTIRNTLQADRDDIRFTDKDQVSWLPYELETGASGELYAWVLVPQIDGNSSSDYIVMHYNDKVDGAVPNRQNPSNVWADYSGVWHFAEASGGILDSTAYQNAGTQTGTVSRVSDFVGRAAEFNNSTERFTVPYDISMNVSGAAWAVHAWIYTNTCFTYASSSLNLINRGTSGSFWAIRGARRGFAFEGYDPAFDIAGGTLGGSGSGWSDYTSCGGHMVAVYDPSANPKSRLYFNGVQVDSDNTTRTVEALQSLVIGNTGSSTTARVDEVRLSRGALSANYIRLSYQNQKSSNSLVSP